MTDDPRAVFVISQLGLRKKHQKGLLDEQPFFTPFSDPFL
jgi:hypothetical protein